MTQTHITERNDGLATSLLFFMEKDKANARTGHLMVSDHHRPRPRAIPEELQVRCRPLRWRYTCFLLVPSLHRPGNIAAGRPLQAGGRKCHVSRWCGWYLSLWRTVRLEIQRQATGQTVPRNSANDKRTARTRLYAKPKWQAFHR